MKHLKVGRKFSREKKQREALLKIMLGDLILKKKIKTTLAKAKELKMLGENIIGKLKEKKNIQLIKSRLPRNITPAILEDIAVMTASRKSGFLRVIKLVPRCSDGALMATIEIIKDEKGKIFEEEKRKNDKQYQFKQKILSFQL